MLHWPEPLVVQPGELGVPKSDEKLTGAPVVAELSLWSVTVAVSVVDVVPGRSTVVRLALRATLTARPETHALKCGSEALIVCATGSMVDGTGIACPSVSMK